MGEGMDPRMMGMLQMGQGLLGARDSGQSMGGLLGQMTPQMMQMLMQQQNRQAMNARLGESAAGQPQGGMPVIEPQGPQGNMPVVPPQAQTAPMPNPGMSLPPGMGAMAGGGAPIVPGAGIRGANVGTPLSQRNPAQGTLGYALQQGLQNGTWTNEGGQLRYVGPR